MGTYATSKQTGGILAPGISLTLQNSDGTPCMTLNPNGSASTSVLSFRDSAGTESLRLTLASAAFSFKDFGVNTQDACIIDTNVAKTTGLVLHLKQQGTGVHQFFTSGVYTIVGKMQLTGAGVSVTTANTSCTIKANSGAALTTYDTIINSTQTKTAGGLLDIQNNSVSKWAYDFNGKPIVPAGGAAGVVGTSVLSSGTVTVSTTAVTANSIIFLTRLVAGGTVGVVQVGTITAGTSFVINSVQPGTASTVQAADTSTVGWLIIN